MSQRRRATRAYLILPAFELVQYRFGFRAYVQFCRVVHQKYRVRPVDEPLTHVVERKYAVHVLAHLQYSGDLYDVHLRTKRRTHAVPTFKTDTPGPWHPTAPHSSCSEGVDSSLWSVCSRVVIDEIRWHFSIKTTDRGSMLVRFNQPKSLIFKITRLLTRCWGCSTESRTE